MFRSTPPADEFEFSGDGNMSLTFDNSIATVDASRGDYQQIATLQDTAHGYKAGSLIYIEGTTNYNGLRKIDAVAANTINLMLGKKRYAAETITNAATGSPKITYNEPFLLIGFELTLDGAHGTSESFVITVNADKGAAWDLELYSRDMNGIQHLYYNFPSPRRLRANDLVQCTFVNTGADLWGLKLIASRIA
jgi:hypothetical protein